MPPEQRVPDLEDRLVEDEGRAILAWLIRGAADSFTGGLAEPASVRAATAAYERDTDTVGRFVDEQCTTGDPGARHLQVKVSDLRQAYETWCRVEGEEAVTSKALTTALRTRFGVIPGRDRQARFYSGIRLADVSHDSGEPRREQPRWTQDGVL